MFDNPDSDYQVVLYCSPQIRDFYLDLSFNYWNSVSYSRLVSSVYAYHIDSNSPIAILTPYFNNSAMTSLRNEPCVDPLTKELNYRPDANCVLNGSETYIARYNTILEKDINMTILSNATVKFFPTRNLAVNNEAQLNIIGEEEKVYLKLFEETINQTYKVEPRIRLIRNIPSDYYYYYRDYKLLEINLNGKWLPIGPISLNSAYLTNFCEWSGSYDSITAYAIIDFNLTDNLDK